mmetsp:Transcript_13012/g.24442  ORF Transcript_13012/g.24442 Transcript_13012/m.24442 type:complete len:549 (-) Transcript_13012:2728-4374(-)
MGDSRISISLEIEGLSKSCSFVLSADASLAELMSEVQNCLLSEIKKQYTFNSTDTAADNENIGLCLAIYDCTLSPPIDITVQVNKFCATTGPNSVTLQRLGLFPSAKLVVFDSRNNSLRDSLLQSNLHKDEDFEYNLPNGTYSQKVEKRSTVLPSQLMQVVKHRFDIDHDESSVTEALPSKPFKGRTEKERRAKLDAWLQRLDESPKKSKVSSQVRKMLIKSRADGNNNIRVEDRFYINTVLIDESENNELSFSQGKEEKEKVVHYFFGRSSNVGSVVSKAVSGLNIGNERMAELLVLDRHLSDGVNKSIYRRLPNTLPIYEAETMGYIENFDRVIIRVFDMNAGGSTELLTSLMHGAIVGSNNQNDKTTSQPHILDGQVESIDNSDTKNAMTMNEVDVISKEQLKFYNDIKCRIEQFDSMNQKKKSTSMVSEKVRQMLIKGRAKGNKKCHEQDRIYLEVLYFQDDLTVLSSYVFLSKFDQINKFVNCLPNWDTSVRDFTLLTEPDSGDGSNGPCYRFVPSDLKYTDAEEKGLLRSFQRIILVINHQI